MKFDVQRVKDSVKEHYHYDDHEVARSMGAKCRSRLR